MYLHFCTRVCLRPLPFEWRCLRNLLGDGVFKTALDVDAGTEADGETSKECAVRCGERRGGIPADVKAVLKGRQ